MKSVAPECLGSSVAVLAEDDHDMYVVAIQRDNLPHIPFPNMWELPGGTIEPGESDIVCALREAEEEVGVVVDEASIVWSAQYPSLQRPDAYFGFHVAHGDLRSVARQLRLGNEGQACDLLLVGHFLHSPNVILDHRQRLADYMGQTALMSASSSYRLLG